MDPRVEIIAWLVFILIVSGFLGGFAFVVWRNDQKPRRTVPRGRVTPYPLESGTPPEEKKDG